jgi:hypothetical protein
MNEHNKGTDQKTQGAIVYPTGLRDPGPFMFVFPHGRAKWASEMTREELLHVIDYLQGASEYHKAEALKAYELARL